MNHGKDDNQNHNQTTRHCQSEYHVHINKDVPQISGWLEGKDLRHVSHKLTVDMKPLYEADGLSQVLHIRRHQLGK
jgi:hypothetical protein